MADAKEALFNRCKEEIAIYDHMLAFNQVPKQDRVSHVGRRGKSLLQDLMAFINESLPTERDLQDADILRLRDAQIAELRRLGKHDEAEKLFNDFQQQDYDMGRLRASFRVRQLDKMSDKDASAHIQAIMKTEGVFRTESKKDPKEAPPGLQILIHPICEDIKCEGEYRCNKCNGLPHPVLQMGWGMDDTWEQASKSKHFPPGLLPPP